MTRTVARDGEALMATFVLIHGAGDGGWVWHLVDAALRGRGHEVVAPDLPADDASAGLVTYVDAVIEAIDRRTDLVVRDDRFLPAPLLRRVSEERLGITPDEIEGGHCLSLSRPDELAERLESYLDRSAR